MPDFTTFAPGRFCWVDLMSKDFHAAKVFYGKVFGWETREMDTQGGPPYAGFVANGKTVAGLGEMSPEMKQSGVPASWNSYVSVADAGESVGKAEAAGGKVIVPPMQIVDAGHMAVVSDPTGAMLSLWQPNQTHGVELANENGAWVWGEVMTPDPATARKFYENVFGWTFKEKENTPGQYWEHFVDGRANGGMMAMDESMQGIPPHWSVYFMADDVAATCDVIKSAGGGIMHGPFPTEVGDIAICHDPDGASFNVIKMIVPADGPT